MMIKKYISIAICSALAGFSVGAHAAGNLLKNNGFESGLQNWILVSGNESISSVEKHGGAYSAVELAGNRSEYRQLITLVPGKKYVASAWVKVTGSVGTDWGGMHLSVVSLVGSTWSKMLSTQHYNTVSGWQKAELRFTAETADYLLLVREQGGANRDVSGFWDDIEIMEDVGATVANNSGNHAMILRHEKAANDHIESWMKVMGALGVEYDFWYDTYSDTNIDHGALPATNRIDVTPNMLIDADGKARNSIFIHGGGSGGNLTSIAGSNLRAYIKGGGNYFGSCMGLWNAAAGYYYDPATVPNSVGMGLLGQKADGTLGDTHKFGVHGYQLSYSAPGAYQLNMSHPINLNLAYGSVNDVKYAGSGYFDTQLAGSWTSVDWNANIDVIAYASGFPATVGTDTNFGNTINGKPTAVEYKKPAPTFGRVLGSLTHPEHTAGPMPYLVEMLKYALYGAGKTDTSGNHKPVGEFATDKLVYTGTSTVRLSAVNVSDVDGNAVDAMWNADQKLLSHNNNSARSLTWNATANSGNNYSGTITLTPLDKPYRILMRLKDNGVPARITEKSRLVAVNLADADGIPVDFDFTPTTISGNAPLTVNFTISNVRGDQRAGSMDAYLDFGDGFYFSNSNLTWANSAITKTNVYLAPGKYTASAAVKDNDGVWSVKTVNIVAY